MDEDWIEVGGWVAQFNTWESTATLTQVERMTKTQIILTNGDRYRKDRLSRPMNRRAGWGKLELRPADHPTVKWALARQDVSSLRWQLEDLIRTIPDEPERLLDLLDKLTSTVEDTRERVKGLIGEHDPEPEDTQEPDLTDYGGILAKAVREANQKR